MRLLWRGQDVEFHQAISSRYQALDDAPLIPLDLIHQGKHLPNGIRPIRLLRQRVPGVQGEALDGQDPQATCAPAQIVTGVEGRCGGLLRSIGCVEELLLGVVEPALDRPHALGGVAPRRLLLGLRSWSTWPITVLLRVPWGRRVVPRPAVARHVSPPPSL